MTIRSDFYASYQEFPELIELTQPSGKVDLRRPTAYKIGNMIRLPAEAAGLRFEQEPETGQRLDQALRDAASATPESLPLLEHVLSLLYDKQSVRGDDLMRWPDYRELGELKGALARHAEAEFSTLQSDEQKAFPVVMRCLVTLGQGEEEVPNRRTVPYRDFVASEGIDQDQKAGAKGFVDLFIEKRLLVADTDPQGEVMVSVALGPSSTLALGFEQARGDLSAIGFSEGGGVSPTIRAEGAFESIQPWGEPPGEPHSE